MSVDRIRVTLGTDKSNVVGTAVIEHNGDLVIRVPGSNLVRELEHMITVDQIRGLALGVEYQAVKIKEYYCPRCDKSFPDMLLMQGHLTLAHPEMEEG